MRMVETVLERVARQILVHYRRNLTANSIANVCAADYPHETNPNWTVSTVHVTRNTDAGQRYDTWQWRPTGNPEFPNGWKMVEENVDPTAEDTTGVLKQVGIENNAEAKAWAEAG